MLNWFRAAVDASSIDTCKLSQANGNVPISHNTVLYRQRHRIASMFGKPKDWRRIHTGHDRCANTFMSAIFIAATVIFWFNQRGLSLEGH